jgi:lipoprotein-anchoring transpeptidase ErfK/SrfK
MAPPRKTIMITNRRRAHARDAIRTTISTTISGWRPRSGCTRAARPGSRPCRPTPIRITTPVDYDDEVDPNEKTASLVDDPTGEGSGAITIDTRKRKLYLSLGAGQAIEYGIGVGREGFAWKGVAQIGRKAFWPGWTPPPEMLLRRPDLPRHMDGGMENPLGARALYLFKGDKDTLFRIHGTNEPDTIGRTHCSVSTEPTSPTPLVRRYHRAASACSTPTCSISIGASERARAWW